MRYVPVEQLIVEHTTYINAKDEMRKCMESFGKTAEPRCIPILGPSGSGKSTVIQKFAEDYPVEILEEGYRRPLLTVQTPANPTQKAMASAVLKELGDPLYSKGTEIQMTERIIDYFVEQEVRLLVLDDMQNIIDRDSDCLNFKTAEWLKRIISDKRAPMPTAIFGLEQTTELFRVNEQLRRRFRRAISMDTFGWDDKKKRIALRGFLKKLKESLPFEDDLVLHSHEMAYRMYCATGGLVGYIMAIVREAKKIADGCLDGIIRQSHLAEAYVNVVNGNELIGVNPFMDKEDVIKAALTAVKPPEPRDVPTSNRKGKGASFGKKKSKL